MPREKTRMGLTRSPRDVPTGFQWFVIFLRKTVINYPTTAKIVQIKRETNTDILRYCILLVYTSFCTV